MQSTEATSAHELQLHPENHIPAASAFGCSVKNGVDGCEDNHTDQYNLIEKKKSETGFNSSSNDSGKKNDNTQIRLKSRKSSSCTF